EGCKDQCPDFGSPYCPSPGFDLGPAPTHFKFGTVRTTRVDFNLPSYDVPLGFFRVYESRDPSSPAYLDGRTALRDPQDNPTSVGLQWRHAYQDEIIVNNTNFSAATRPDYMYWRGLGSIHESVKFLPV